MFSRLSQTIYGSFGQYGFKNKYHIYYHDNQI